MIDVLDRIDRVGSKNLGELRYQLTRHARATRPRMTDAELLGVLADLGAEGLLRAGKITLRGRRALESAERDCTGRAVLGPRHFDLRERAA